jgi:protein-L-isoaspartate(D-aspartate) O-methyltransferase
MSSLPLPVHVGAEARIAFLMALRAKGLRDTSILRAFETVPRGRFVPRRFIDLALTDVALPIACGQTTLAPSQMAEVLVALDPRPEHRVLEIGSGSGYGTAILARLAGEVVSIERYRSLAVEARGRLEAQGVGNAEILHGDGRLGHLGGMPYDRILIEASVEYLPAELLAQLAPAGRIVCVERSAAGSVLVRHSREAGGDLVREALSRFTMPPLMIGTAAAL